MLYSTYLGGNDDTLARSIAFDAWGDVFVVGDTVASNFTTQGAFQSTFAGEQDAFVLRLDGPVVQAVSISGKQLIVVGNGFDVGAILLVNDQEQRTINSTNLNGRLIGKKAAVGIAPGQTVSIRVRNIDDTLSNEFLFTRPAVE